MKIFEELKRVCLMFFLAGSIFLLIGCSSIKNQMEMRSVLKEASFTLLDAQVVRLTFISGYTISTEQLHDGKFDIRKLAGEFLSSGFDPKIQEVVLKLTMKVENHHDKVKLMLDAFSLKGELNSHDLVKVNNKEPFSVYPGMSDKHEFEVTVPISNKVIKALSEIKNNNTLAVKGKVKVRGELGNVDLPAISVNVDQKINISDADISNAIRGSIKSQVPSFMLPMGW